jgi:TonB-dependent receptor
MSIRRFRSLLAAVALSLAPGLALAQGTGQVAGRVLDQATGRPLASARVAVQGTQLAALSGVDGRYTLTGVPAGTVTLTVALLSYAPKTVTGVVVRSGASTAQDITLQARGIALEGLTVTAAVERGSVNRALDEQRTSVGVVNSVTSEQIARSPDSDAAQAVQRVAGVTVQGGQYVFVRGLGERYTTTSLNGARIPSPEPEKRVVPLDLFPASLLQSVTTSKTFTPDQPGDFSGAQVNIRTREYPARPTLNFSLSGGFNSEVTGRERPFAPTAGGDFFGFGAGNREIAERTRQANLNALTNAERNGLINSFRNVWSTEEKSGAPNVSASASLGGSSDVLGRDFGYLASATFSRSSEARVGQVRGTALAGDEGTAVEAARFTGTTAQTSVLWGGLLNLSYRLGQGSRIDFNNSYNRSADNEGRTELGTWENFGANVPLMIDRLRYVERSVRSNQLRGEHLLGGRHQATWSISSSEVSRVEPDRSEVLYSSGFDPVTGDELPYAWFGPSNQSAVRTFGDLGETAWEGSGDFQYQLGRGARAHRIKVGGLYRFTERDAENFSFSISAPSLARGERVRSPEEIFDGRFTGGSADVLQLTNLSAGGSYAAQDRLAAGYGMMELFITERVRLIGGARVERSELEVNSVTVGGERFLSEPAYTDVLPSVALNWGLNDVQNLRFSYSRTLSRPEYREISPVTYRDVLAGEEVRGNPDLQRALIDNFDARWELYPGSGEVFSVALFAKRFHDPIERIYRGTSGTPLTTFVNAESALNYGVELEARKELGFLGERFSPFSAFANATLMRSTVEIADSLTLNEDRAMVGQAPYVVNAGLAWSGADNRASATLLYNVVGERIVSAGEFPLEDVKEQARHVVDFSVRVPVRRGWDLKLDAENLLDSEYEALQGAVVRERYRTGRSLTVGIGLRN